MPSRDAPPFGDFGTNTSPATPRSLRSRPRAAGEAGPLRTRFHPRRMLSIRRVAPTEAAAKITAGFSRRSTGRSESAARIST